MFQSPWIPELTLRMHDYKMFDSLVRDLVSSITHTLSPSLYHSLTHPLIILLTHTLLLTYSLPLTHTHSLSLRVPSLISLIVMKLSRPISTYSLNPVHSLLPSTTIVLWCVILRNLLIQIPSMFKHCWFGSVQNTVMYRRDMVNWKFLVIVRSWKFMHTV